MGKFSEIVRGRLTKLRLDRGFTQGQVGRAVGWTQTAVSKFELGDIGADLDVLAAFAVFYGVSLSDLVAEQGPAKPADPQAQAISDLVARLTGEQRAALLVMLGAVTVKPRPSGPARRSVLRASTAKGLPIP